MPEAPHRFLSLGCLTPPAGNAGKTKMARDLAPRKCHYLRILRKQGSLTKSNSRAARHVRAFPTHFQQQPAGHASYQAKRNIAKTVVVTISLLPLRPHLSPGAA
jgi:hypothetical protein